MVLVVLKKVKILVTYGKQALTVTYSKIVFFALDYAL